MKQLLVFLLLLCSASVSAQDVIVKKDGSTILSKVLEVGQDVVKYKNFSNLDGPTYTISKSELQAINYQNGAKDTFSAPVHEENRYLPNNQNDGEQMFNDRALLAMDAAAHNFSTRKSKRLKTIGWIGGPALAAFGVVLIAADDYDFFGFNSSDESLLGIGFIGLGAVWTGGFLIAANHEKKKAQMLDSSTIIQYNFHLAGEATLSAGIDMIKDRSLASRTLGLGIRYNF